MAEAEADRDVDRRPHDGRLPPVLRVVAHRRRAYCTPCCARAGGAAATRLHGVPVAVHVTVPITRLSVCPCPIPRPLSCTGTPNRTHCSARSAESRRWHPRTIRELDALHVVCVNAAICRSMQSVFTGAASGKPAVVFEVFTFVTVGRAFLFAATAVFSLSMLPRTEVFGWWRYQSAGLSVCFLLVYINTNRRLGQRHVRRVGRQPAGPLDHVLPRLQPLADAGGTVSGALGVNSRSTVRPTTV